MLTERKTGLAAALDRVIASDAPEEEIRATVRSLVRRDNMTGYHAGVLVAKLLAIRLQECRKAQRTMIAALNGR